MSSRILLARFRGRYTNLTIIVVYMPTSVRSNPSQEDTYKDLRQVLNQISKHDAVILMGDFIAKLARGPDAHVGRWCIHTRANAGGNDYGAYWKTMICLLYLLWHNPTMER